MPLEALVEHWSRQARKLTEAGVTDPSEILVEAMVEHWKLQARKLIEAGVPIERVAESMMNAALDVENERLASLLRKAKDRMAAMVAAIHEARAERPLTDSANQTVMPDAARVAEEKTDT